jgi:hypothetical protein
MPSYRIHRLKDHLRQSFRFAPHVSGTASVKPRDYEAADTVEAVSPYGAFFALRESGTPLEVGDLLEVNFESSSLEGKSTLRIFKFVGFEEAQWVIPEVKPGGEPPVAGSGGGAAPAGTGEPQAALQ